MHKLKGKGNPSLRDKAYLFERICSTARWANISIQNDKVREMVWALADYNKAVSDDYNGHPISDRQYKIHCNRMFWALARKVCCDYEFVRESRDEQ
mgnify:CR=1 FL=1